MLRVLPVLGLKTIVKADFVLKINLIQNQNYVKTCSHIYNEWHITKIFILNEFSMILHTFNDYNTSKLQLINSFKGVHLHWFIIHYRFYYYDKVYKFTSNYIFGGQIIVLFFLYISIFII